MLGNPNFNHQTIRRIISVFGSLFNDLQVIRLNPDNSVAQTINVPVVYGPKERWFYRNSGDPHAGSISGEDTQLPVQSVLPVITYELASINYLAHRKKQTMIKNVATAATGTLNWAYNFVPVELNFTLRVTTKNLSDGFQIIEQIVPYFTPDLTVSVKDAKDLGLEGDVAFVLNYPISYQDNWMTDFSDRREATWELGFSAETRMYGAVQNSKIILTEELGWYPVEELP